MSARLDLAEIRRNNPLPEIAGRLLMLKARGSEWVALCPFHAERSASFTVYRASDGEWRGHCFGCGWRGDVIDFTRQAHGVTLIEAARMLGAGEIPAIDLPLLPPAERVDRTAEARAIWRAAGPVAGTAAEVYLRWRGLTIDPPLSLRYAELPYGKTGPVHPCLVCCVSSVEGPLQGIQRIYLAEDGRGKADVAKPKLSLGKVRGGAIRLAPLDGDQLIVCEGPEDGLTLLQELGRPVWVAAGSSMLPAMQFPPSIRSIAIGGDNDDAGKAAAHKAARSFAERGLAVRVFYPVPGHKDYNDELQGVRA